MDVLRLFEDLQKESQKALTTITDILMAKDILIRQLNMMKDNPYPFLVARRRSCLTKERRLLKKRKALEDLEDVTCLRVYTETAVKCQGWDYPGINWVSDATFRWRSTCCGAEDTGFHGCQNSCYHDRCGSPNCRRSVWISSGCTILWWGDRTLRKWNPPHSWNPIFKCMVLLSYITCWRSQCLEPFSANWSRHLLHYHLTVLDLNVQSPAILHWRV